MEKFLFEKKSENEGKRVKGKGIQGYKGTKVEGYKGERVEG